MVNAYQTCISLKDHRISFKILVLYSEGLLSCFPNNNWRIAPLMYTVHSTLPRQVGWSNILLCFRYKQIFVETIYFVAPNDILPNFLLKNLMLLIYLPHVRSASTRHRKQVAGVSATNWQIQRWRGKSTKLWRAEKQCQNS